MKKRWIGVIVAMLFIAFVTAFNYGGCGEKSSSSGSSASTPKTQQIYANGSYGAWNGDSVAGAITATASSNSANVSVTDNISGFTTSLRVKNVTGSPNYTRLEIQINNAQTATEFVNGHLRFNIRLETAPANINTLRITFGSGSTPVNLSPASLSTTQFTHIDIPLLNMFPGWTGYAGNPLFQLISDNTENPDVPIVTLNDIKWTTD